MQAICRVIIAPDATELDPMGGLAAYSACQIVIFRAAGLAEYICPLRAGVDADLDPALGAEPVAVLVLEVGAEIRLNLGERVRVSAHRRACKC